ncbi:MAG: DNA alkylation repair protein [Kineosporiaceae bacterium]
MADFKDEIGPQAVAGLADELAQAWPAFPRVPFLADLPEALAPLELMQRVRLVAARLGEALPREFPEAAGVLWAALERESFTGWITLPVGTYVTAAGLDEPDTALPLLARLTPRFSSEGPIRPFLVAHPAVTFRYLREWVDDPDEHVRRLVSEGTRPRLPWAPVLRAFVADPSPAVELLDRLVDDPSPYVRRSVANHLNDIAKDHPDVALACARRWYPTSDGTRWVVRHGLRTLVKHGDPEALALLGADTAADVRLVDLTVTPGVVEIGGRVTITFTLELVSPAEADAIIDYRVAYRGARGPKAPKVFKLTRRSLTARAPLTITREHAFEHVSIRRIRPGGHTIDVQVNGRVLGSATLEVVDTS